MIIIQSILIKVLKEVYLSKSTKIVLDCAKEKVMDVLKQAQQVGLISEGYYYLITSLDAHTLNMEEFKVCSVRDYKIMLPI